MFPKQVLCINDGPLPGDCWDDPKLSMGTEYTALYIEEGEDEHEQSVGDCYVLAEFPYRHVFQVERFIDATPGEEETAEVAETELQEAIA